MLKSKYTDILYPDSAEIPVYCWFSDAMPLNILRMYYNYLTFYRNHPVKSLENICLRKLSDAISERNYVISKDESPLTFSSIKSFNNWISHKVIRGMNSCR